MRISLRILSVLILLQCWVIAYAQDDEARLLYCREDLELTGIYPLSKSQYLATDFGEIPNLPGRRARNIVLRLIGPDGLSQDSLSFRSSIREVVPIGESSAIVNVHSYSYSLEVREGKFIKKDSATNLRDYKWLLTSEKRQSMDANSVRQLKKVARANSDKLRDIDMMGVYGDWVVMVKRQKSKKGKKAEDAYAVIHRETEKVIWINPPEPIKNKGWQNLDKKFINWRRTVFFIGDDIYVSQPETGKCYVFNTKTEKVSFFSFPDSQKGLWFFTYDYIQKKKYLVSYDKQQFELFLFKSSNEKLLKLKTTKSFDNYVFNNHILVFKEEKGHRGKVACFYVIPIYKEEIEWQN